MARNRSRSHGKARRHRVHGRSHKNYILIPRGGIRL